VSYARRHWSWHHPELHARLVRLKAPDKSPLELSAIVLHLRLDPGAETGPEAPLLTSMLASAVAHLERYCSCAIMAQEWRLTLRSRIAVAALWRIARDRHRYRDGPGDRFRRRAG
jgi:hypothetical protein